VAFAMVHDASSTATLPGAGQLGGGGPGAKPEDQAEPEFDTGPKFTSPPGQVGRCKSTAAAPAPRHVVGRLLPNGSWKRSSTGLM